MELAETKSNELVNEIEQINEKCDEKTDDTITTNKRRQRPA